MKRWIVCLTLLWSLAQAKTVDLMTLPEGTGLPLVVNVGISFIEVTKIDENEGTFDATIDIRMRWSDKRHRFRKDATATGYKDFRNSDAEQQIAAMWVPTYDLENLSGEPSEQRFGLRINHDGRIEMLHRLAGTFKANFDVERFPFDIQHLPIEFKSHKLNNERLSFEFTQEELEFSLPPHEFQVTGWKGDLVSMERKNVQAWYEEKNSQIVASFAVHRDPSSTFSIIFLPLLASLLIPLMVIWLNQAEIGGFKVEAFELTNISIGGLFAVVALNFTILSSFATLSGSSNCVNQLFSLNYLALGISFAVNIVLYKFGMVGRWFGDHVQEEFYKYLNWAMPVFVLLTSAAIILYAIL